MVRAGLLTTPAIAGTAPQMAPVARQIHPLYEDALALLIGTMLVSLGIFACTKASILVGGSAGLALLLQYATGWNFWVVFSLVNVPFYGLAMWRMGWAFTLRTFIAVSVVSILVRETSLWMEVGHISPVYAMVASGCLLGLGLLALFRHRTGLGGVNILAIYVQEKTSLRAGVFQMGLDALIMAGGFAVLPWENALCSIVCSGLMNLTLALYHRPDRYLGVTG